VPLDLRHTVANDLGPPGHDLLHSGELCVDGIAKIIGSARRAGNDKIAALATDRKPDWSADL
jgi:hypothetical protein